MNAPDITAPMVLPEDVLVMPVSELSEKDRAAIEAEEGQFAITRLHARAPSKIVGPHSAGILERFRESQPITAVIASYSQDHGLDPRETLREAFPFLRSCMYARILVPADSPLSARIVPILVPRDRVDDAEIVRCVKVTDDTEIYQARSEDHGVHALKVLRPECAEWIRDALHREAEVLSFLGGRAGPALLGRGICDGRDYLAIEWCPGVMPAAAADEVRAEAGPDADARLLAVGRSILEAYCRLHELGVLHGDVHPPNLVIDHSGVTRILDLGFALRLDDGGPRPPRAGSPYYRDPQYADAYLEGRPEPPMSAASEQYSLAAVLYYLIVGRHARDFPPELAGLLRAVRDQPVLPFASRGVAPWPELEAVLARALSHRPEDRFDDTADFLAAWSDVSPRPAADTPVEDPTLVGLRVATESFLERSRLDGPLWRDGLGRAPQCSVALGSAGIAHALYRMACIRESPELLFRADAWAARALADLERPDALYDDDRVPVDKLGRVSPYHSESGVYAVRALVGHAVGDQTSVAASASEFVKAVDRECDVVDLWLGWSGVLLACANLLQPVESAVGRHDELRALGDRVAARLADTLAGWGPVRDNPHLPNYGMAHGWAGVLYAVLRWTKRLGRDADPWIASRLDELADCAEPDGRGVRWPWRDRLPGHGDGSLYGPGWCSGSAGFVQLWTLAGVLLGREDYVDLAHRAAWHVWEGPTGAAHLCCGFAGRAYALLNLYKVSGDPGWRRRAVALTERAHERSPDMRETESDATWADAGLYRGDPGVALLVSELESPELACMPFFGDEGWPALH